MLQSRQWFIMAAIALLVGLAWWVDVRSDIQTDLDVVYMLPIAMATWALGTRWGIAVGLACIAFATVQSISSHEAAWLLQPTLYWNSVTRVVLYSLAVALSARLRSAKASLERTVEERTAQLRANAQVQLQLERQLLRAEEAERRRVGRDLHDSLGQELTGIAFLSEVLKESLDAKGLPESADAARLAKYATAAVRRAGVLARGLCPVELHGGALAAAVRELAEQVEEVFRLRCAVEDGQWLESISDGQIATQVYRIVQEAVRNAVRHSQGTQITIRASAQDGWRRLEIEDDGIGLPSEIPPEGGIGLSVMRYRAASIHGTLSIMPAQPRGTIVQCDWPSDTSGLASRRAS